MTNLKRRVASHKILQFLENNKVIFFFQKKSVQNDHWRLLKKKIAKVEGVASLNLKNKRDKKEIQPLILSLHQRCKDSRESVSVDLFYDIKKTKVKKNPPFDCSTAVETPHPPFGEANTISTQLSPPLCKNAVFAVPSKEKTKKQKTKQDICIAKANVQDTFANTRKTNVQQAKTTCSPSSHRISWPTPSYLPLQMCVAQAPSFFQEKNKVNAHICGANVKQDREKESGSEIVERICGLLYAPNLILGSDSLKKLAFLSHQLKEDSNLIFIGGWDGNQLINHLDSLKLLETPQDIWKEGLSCLSSCYGRPYLFLCSLLEKRKNFLVYSLKEKMRALTRSLQERQAQQIKEQ